jgi:hypothetical protein
MNAQHKFKTNQLGLTYTEWGMNLDYQLQLNYKKLYGKEPKSTRTSIKRQSGSNYQNAGRI